MTMNLGCAIGGHRADRRQTYNSGYYFGQCRRCGDYLIRSAHGEWRSVPRGHRVVWKAGRHNHSLEADFAGVLPVVREETRALVPARPRPATKGAAAAEECEDYRYPRLLFLGLLCGSGVKSLAGLASGR